MGGRTQEVSNVEGYGGLGICGYGPNPNLNPEVLNGGAGIPGGSAPEAQMHGVQGVFRYGMRAAGPEGPFFQQARYTRMECPRFEGDKFKDWSYKIEQFFEVEGVLEAHKIRTVSAVLEGRALHWHQAYMGTLAGRLITWNQYVTDMSHRFANASFEDPVADLKQWGSVKDYQDQFERILSQAIIPENFAISCFLSGLNKKLEIAVRSFSPQSLPQAMY
ncbi:Retrotransposon gag protein [Quillaja saponaria]|uniref:Retrotransposon gag protein n=1 Tax=Quillaja saponaria TaxID=32244 RepID=A0AAD7LL50_QUISA|nr:Retrotransposon gag protein [Quillaja saponaria]